MPADANHYLEETDANRYLHDDDDEPAAQQVDANHYLDEPGPTAESYRTAEENLPTAVGVAGNLASLGASATLGGVPGVVAGVGGGYLSSTLARAAAGDPNPVDVKGDTEATAVGMLTSLLAAALTRRFGKVAQLVGSVAAGDAARRLLGSPDPENRLAMAFDALAPLTHSAVRSTYRGVTAPKSRQSYGDVAVDRALSAEGITPMLANDVIHPDQAPPQFVQPTAKGVFSSAADLMMHAENQWVRDLGERLHRHPRFVRDLRNSLDVNETELTKDLTPGSPVDPDASTLVQAGHLQPGHVNAETLDHAVKMRDFWEQQGRIGAASGYFNPNAPVRQRYFGPVISKTQAAAAAATVDPITAARMVAPSGTSRRDLSSHARTSRFNPATDVTNAGELIKIWRQKNEKGIAASYAFGPKPEDMLSRAITDLTNHAGQGGQADFGDVANKLSLLAGQPAARNSGELQALGDSYARRYQGGERGSIGQAIIELLAHQQQSPTPAGGEQAVSEFGQIANDRIARALNDPTLSDSDRAALRMGIKDLQRIYHREPTSDLEYAGGRLGQGISSVLLATSAPKQVGQVAGTTAHVGFGNQIEGLIRSMRDPDYMPILRARGAAGGAMAEQIQQMRPGTKPTWTGKMMSGIEKHLRSTLAPGTIPYYEQVLEDARAYGVQGKAPPAGLVRQMREMDIDPTAPYTPSAEGAAGAHNRLISDVQLLSNETGQSSDMMIGTAGGRSAFQFMPFGTGAARLAKRHYLEPLGAGLRGDTSELKLATDRLARLVPASLAAEGVGRLISDAMQLKIPMSNDEGEQDKYIDKLATEVPWRAAGTNFGMPVDVAQSIYRGMGAAAKNPEDETGARYAERIFRGIGAGIGDRAPPYAELMVHKDPWKLGLTALGVANPAWGSKAALALPAVKQAWNAATAESADIPQMERPQGYVGSPMPENYGEAQPSPEPSYMPGVTTLERPPVSDFMGPPEPPPEERYLYGVYNYPQ